MPLWLPENGGSAVGVKVKPGGLLSLESVLLPTLVFVVKETKPEVTNTEDVYVA